MTQVPKILVLFGHLGGAMGHRYLLAQVATVTQEPNEYPEMFLTRWGITQIMAGVVGSPSVGGMES